jgi:hypothetical protein
MSNKSIATIATMGIDRCSTFAGSLGSQYVASGSSGERADRWSHCLSFCEFE